MRQVVVAVGSILLLLSCTHPQPASGNTTRTTLQDSSDSSTGIAKTLLALSQEWVDTWNQRDIERMAEMHGDVTRTIYVIGETSSTVEWLLREIREKNFWDLSWKIAMVDRSSCPHPRRRCRAGVLPARW